VRTTQKQLYRSIAGMSRDEKIACGAYVYFTFPRPLAEEAGIAAQLDWTVPRDSVGSSTTCCRRSRARTIPSI